MARVFTVHTPLGPETLKFFTLTGQEYLSRPFEFELAMLSPSPSLAMDSLLGQGITVEVETQGQGRRYLHGECARFSLIGRHGRYHRYSARIVPWLWYLTRASDFRIFQNMTVPDILDAVFGAYPYALEKRLTGQYRTWEYCVQYHETDFNFVSRLMEHEGIYYHFEHAMGQLTLVLDDSIGSHVPIPGHATIPYLSPDATTVADEEHVRSWQVSKEITSGGFLTDDYDFKRPHSELKQWKIDPHGHPNAEHRIYDYPGGYTEIGDGANYVKVRLDELKAPHELLQGETTVRALGPGYLFSLYRCPRGDQNREYLVVSASYYMKDNPYEIQGGGEGTVWQINFTCQESAVQYRPPRVTPKPLASGPESAIVVGPAGEEIYTDEYGRVKVQFHWDQYGKYDENSSCWMRVSNGWAGTGYGIMFLPRIRQEVIVDFLGGDPDCPIITGRVYNAEQKVPYELPKYSAYSTIKSRSTKHGGVYDGNEMRFDDRKGKEQYFMLAQWRMDIRVKWKMYETIKEWRHTGIYGGYALTVGGNQENHVGGALYQRVDGKVGMSAGGDIGIVAESSYGLQAASNVEINAKNITIEGSVGITLKVGGNFIKIDPGGVIIQGTSVRINSGGAGTGTGPLIVEDPVDAEPADDGTPGFLDRPRTGGKGGGRKKRGGAGQHAGKGYASAEAAAVAAMQAHNPASVAENREYGGWIKKNSDGTFSPQPAVKGSEAGLENMPDKGPDDVAWWHTHGAVVPDAHGKDKYDSENFSGDDGDKGYSKANNATGYVATPSGAIKKYDPSQDHGAPGEGVSTLPDTAPP